MFLLHNGGEAIGKLQLVQTVFRHGDRTPDDFSRFRTNFYPNNPYTPRDHHPIPAGALTNIGKARSYELGRFYRQAYGKWLGSENAVKFFASMVPRTTVTARLVATGLFPSDPDEKWSESLQLRQIPIHAARNAEESWFYFAAAGLCNNSRRMQRIVEKTEPAVVKYLEENKKFYEYISRHAGYNGTYELAYFLYVALLTQWEVGLKPPKWSEGIFPEGKLKDEAPMVFVIQGFTDELKKFGGAKSYSLFPSPKFFSQGLWLKMWLENIDKYLKNKGADKKLIAWSGHDQNIGSLLVSLDNFDEPHLPDYNSAIILELHEIKQQYYVKILYKRNGEADPLRVLGCPDILCPLEIFRNETASIIPRGNATEICETVLTL
ncbi:venom acid phosphatase Acph-1 [Diachasma alloeum]|uniref:venom acid phosphatase Acph-1 n=1 Tax=Diachasma alloeum TaxID=454923 RepID=UPI0007384C4A|nr:venom acid phosphatase Acph-1 [Diachasma alloeum]